MGRPSGGSAARDGLNQSHGRAANITPILNVKLEEEEPNSCTEPSVSESRSSDSEGEKYDDEVRDEYQVVSKKLTCKLLDSRRRTLTLLTPILTSLVLILLSNTSAGYVLPFAGPFHKRVKRQEVGEESSRLQANNNVTSLPHDEAAVDEFELPLWLNLTCCICLLTLSGLFSGLNLGLMSLDINDLKVIMNSGTKQEKAYAATIAPVRARGNFLLCTLLLGNVLVNTTLTALLDDITGSGSVAVGAATISIVVFGEILPQALCARHGLAVGARTIAITYIFMALTCPLSFPIAFILDCCLGEEIGNVYNREQLVEYIRVTREHNRLEDNEVGIISGALALRTKVAGDVMTPLEQVYMLPIETKLDYNTVTQINARGFSRIPVYADGDIENIVGLLHARDLALVDPGDAADLKSVLDYYKHPMVYVYVDTRLDHILQEFKAGKSHIALVKSIQTKPTKKMKWMRVLGEHPPEEHDVKSGRLLESYEVIQTPKPGAEGTEEEEEEDDEEGDPYYRLEGIITLEDIIEEILGAEIIDESDVLAMKLRERIRDAGPVGKKTSVVNTPLPFDLGSKYDPQNHCDVCCKCICGRKKLTSPSRMGSDSELSRKKRAVSEDMTAKLMKQKSGESTPTMTVRSFTSRFSETSQPIPESTGTTETDPDADAKSPDEGSSSPSSRNKRKNNLLSYSGKGDNRSTEESESLLQNHSNSSFTAQTTGQP